MLASELIVALQEKIKVHGDHPVTFLDGGKDIYGDCPILWTVKSVEYYRKCSMWFHRQPPQNPECFYLSGRE